MSLRESEQRPFCGLAIGLQVLGGGVDLLSGIAQVEENPPGKQRHGEGDDGQHAEHKQARAGSH